jgi:MoCo/4Fe-4S cofactor protein with predicted Tat translocation signal
MSKMKTIPPSCPEPEFGRRYWRSLDQLAETPEFGEWVEREFPAGASEWTDPVSRRNFVKIMSASFLLAGLGFAGSGCRRPEERIMPFGRQPEHYTHGVVEYYATAMPTRSGAIPLVVTSNEGRPTKVEGNATHPDSNGGTDRYAQASILNLYDPDRAQRFTMGGNNASRAAALDFLTDISRRAQGNGGQGLCFLIERSSSPSRYRLQRLITEQFPQARWFVHEPVDLDVHRRAASAAFGAPLKPVFRYDAAKVILSLDCDFIGAEEDAHNNIRRFTQGRRLDQPKDTMNRLYAVESLMSLTGSNAEHRLRVAPSAVVQVAAALASQIGQAAGVPGLQNLGLPAGVDPKWISECAKDLQAHRGESLVVAGQRQPLAVHLLAHAINAALGNLGRTVVLHQAADLREGGIVDLARALEAGEVETLVILNGNPVYTAPADLDWARTQRRAKSVVRLGYYEDETFPVCDWHLPAAHYLESWGDAQTSDGTLVPVQPLIAPLFGGVTELEVLARIAGANATSPYETVRETFAKVAGGGDVEAAWRKFLHDGFLANTAAQPVNAQLDAAAISKALAGIQASAPGKERLDVVFHRDYSLDDGRYGNNGWLQELPDPITKITWDNVVLISRRTAGELGVQNSDVVEIKIGERAVRGPIWVQPGMADFTLGLALGYGRETGGRVAHKVGFNAYAVRTANTQNIATGAALRRVGGNYTIATTQDHWSMQGRPIIREANLEQYREHPDFARLTNMHEPPGGMRSLYPNPLDAVAPQALHQWGMSIDLNACVGCSACVLACQSENNIPIVGKDQVRRGREMHWLRIDRYYTGEPAQRNRLDVYKDDSKQQFEEWIDEPQMVTQPMLCQHCELAPCESVCPVNATVHDHEGLNLMVYNRCVGTRYCSNNCPYKVRRFNYFDYNKRPLDKLYLGPLAKRPIEELNLVEMIKNPDVTVRMRGVMEKCTFCIQRIEQAKISRKVKARDSGDVTVPDGTFTTACAQACPAGAIVFGNIANPDSRVAKLKQNQRDYAVLEFLLTKPRLTYLAKVRNPNPAMPDYREWPLSLREYERTMGNPFEAHGNSHDAGHAPQKGAH